MSTFFNAFFSRQKEGRHSCLPYATDVCDGFFTLLSAVMKPERVSPSKAAFFGLSAGSDPH
jgi:hypothetical protein